MKISDLISNSSSSGEILSEMPQYVSDTSFNLDDPVHNRKEAVALKGKMTEMIEDTADYELFRTGSDAGGAVAMIIKDRGILAYLVKIQRLKKKLSGETVTQVALWRKDDEPSVIGITKRMFFGYLLQHYPAIMSDAQQTKDGARFWKQRMAEATTLGYRVGIVDFLKNTINWYDAKEGAIADWIKTSNGWGVEEKYQGFRFIIAN